MKNTIYLFFPLKMWSYIGIKQKEDKKDECSMCLDNNIINSQNDVIVCMNQKLIDNEEKIVYMSNKLIGNEEKIVYMYNKLINTEEKIVCINQKLI